MVGPEQKGFRVSDLVAAQNDPDLLEAVRAFYQTAPQPEYPPVTPHTPNVVSASEMLDAAAQYRAAATEEEDAE